MLKPNDANNFRRTGVELCLIAAPLVGLVSALVTPRFNGGMRAELTAISEHTGRWLIGEFLNPITFFLFMLAALGIVRLLGHRSRVLGHAGGGLVMLGAYFHDAIIGFALVEVPLVESGGARDRMIGFANQMYESTAFTMILFPFLSFFLGWLLLGVAVWRARVAPIWVAATLGVAPLSEFFGPEALSPEFMFALFLSAFGYVGLGILRMSDEEWEHGASSAPEPVVAEARPQAQ
jgi:hypothetical protein